VDEEELDVVFPNAIAPNVGALIFVAKLNTPNLPHGGVVYICT
jgi:hypothetical protein